MSYSFQQGAISFLMTGTRCKRLFLQIQVNTPFTLILPKIWTYKHHHSQNDINTTDIKTGCVYAVKATDSRRNSSNCSTEKIPKVRNVMSTFLLKKRKRMGKKSADQGQAPFTAVGPGTRDPPVPLFLSGLHSTLISQQKKMHFLQPTQDLSYSTAEYKEKITKIHHLFKLKVSFNNYFLYQKYYPTKCKGTQNFYVIQILPRLL